MIGKEVEISSSNKLWLTSCALGCLWSHRGLLWWVAWCECPNISLILIAHVSTKMPTILYLLIWRQFHWILLRLIAIFNLQHWCRGDEDFWWALAAHTQRHPLYLQKCYTLFRCVFLAANLKSVLDFGISLTLLVARFYLILLYTSLIFHICLGQVKTLIYTLLSN